MKKVLNKLKNVLNNETAGPNLEAMLGLGVSLGVIGGIFIFARAVYSWIYQSSLIVKCYE